MFYPEKPNLMAPTELVKTPNKMSPPGSTAVPSPEVQKEHATRASPQETSVAAALPPGLTEPQGQSDADCLCHMTSSFKGHMKTVLI